MTKNERITESFVRQHFERDSLYAKIKLEEQNTSVQKAKKCLKNASKNMTGEPGHPEFIITFPAYPDNIIVIECKADTKHHKSANVKKTGSHTAKMKPAEYAVDGALHYSSHLSQKYNVLSIAVSGSDKEGLIISSFLQKQNEDKYVEQDGQLLDIHSYLKFFEGEFEANFIESGEITRIAIELNAELNDYSIVEYERCTLVSALFLALRDEEFRKIYQTASRTVNGEPRPDRLAKSVIDAISRVFEEDGIDKARADSMLGEYKKMNGHQLAKSRTIKKKKDTEYEDNFVLRNITEKLERILPLITMGEKGHDLLGRFYTEFIRYAGTDKKTGLVLTPQHVTEMFCDVVELTKDDVVFDPCCGTARFLISAMKEMIFQVGNDEKKKKKIREKQLIGSEIRPDMFTYACSNMIMGGDGKSNIYQEDCFSPEARQRAKSAKPTVALLNPPYDVGEAGQLKFLENALSCLQKGGRGAAIVQMSCATSAKKETVLARQRLLDKHTLLGVFSMPEDLFYPVGVITCVMVFGAHKQHSPQFKTYFGYFKNDGFVKTKHMGRIDQGEWKSIKKRWVSGYINREPETGLSVLHSVTGNDEWCAEAYMETDYSQLSEEDFVKTIKNYVAFKFLEE